MASAHFSRQFNKTDGKRQRSTSISDRTCKFNALNIHTKHRSPFWRAPACKFIRSMNTNLFTQNPTTPQTHTHRQSTTHRNNCINWINTNNFRRFRERNRKVPPGDYKLEMSYEIVKCISNTRLKMITPFWMRHLMAHCILKTITTLTNA